MATKTTPVLAKLEPPAAAIVKRIDQGVAKGWPALEAATSADEYYALRLLAFVRGDDWAVVLERIGGDLPHDPDDPYTAGIRHHIFRREGRQGSAGLHAMPLPLTVPEQRDPASTSIEGIDVTGPAGLLRGSDRMHEQLDLRRNLITTRLGPPQDANFIMLVRAYLATFPDALWPDVETTQQHVGLADHELFLVSTAFEHVVEKKPKPATPELIPFARDPNQSETYRSLARALAARDKALFEPGASNLDWRLWARFPSPAVNKRRR